VEAIDLSLALNPKNAASAFNLAVLVSATRRAVHNWLLPAQSGAAQAALRELDAIAAHHSLTGEERALRFAAGAIAQELRLQLALQRLLQVDSDRLQGSGEGEGRGILVAHGGAQIAADIEGLSSKLRNPGGVQDLAFHG
jgi:hypothetical protein